MSAEVLTDPWFAAVAAALPADDADPPGEDADAVVEVVASGAAAGTVRTRWVVEGGRLVTVAPAGADDPPAATTIPVTAEALAAFARGEADPAVAFMRGDLKPEGSSAAVLALFSAWARPACRAALADVTA